ncbi:purine nucleosidase [Propionibacterium cyclohexanicum]|uniref:Purine nucleosidase n=1 Tax=Propionibacterium cyclohexanicum TaxID=64702 RepID=A0A1H9RXQ0_9ACTN|nr:nucleoside hydrolase [Propionibacterium cyclohexanicum]SER77572.1 purine nucleosidase [Propionibacterium cyclohexanicum]
MTKKVLLDCDPGHDDAVAMLLAQGNPELEVVGLSTVGGNQTLAKVTRNALGLATAFSMTDVPIAAGCARPLVRQPQVAPEIHGESGLGGVHLPLPAMTLDRRHGVKLIIDTVMTSDPGGITLVATGPLTNIAMAARLEPRIVERVAEVVLMGGGQHTGNITPVAEFNVHTDPEAAHIVFHEPWPVTMVGLDLTHQALATDEVIADLGAVPGPVTALIMDLFDAFRAAYEHARGFPAPPVHDPCAVAYCIDPSIVETVPVPVDVELGGHLTEGMTVADFRTPPPADCHTRVATTLDVSRFWALVHDALVRVQAGAR